MAKTPDSADQLERARLLLTPETAQEIGSVYGDTFVFPERQVFESVPGYSAAPLLLAHENQQVCMWALVLEGRHAGKVLVASDHGEGLVAQVYSEDLEEFIAVRRWDGACLEEPLLQSQSAPVEESCLQSLRESFTEFPATYGWPCSENLRFEGDGLRIMLWICEEQTDWWISGESSALRERVPWLAAIGGITDTLWSESPIGSTIVADLRRNGGSCDPS